MEKLVAVFDLEGTLFKPNRSSVLEIPKSLAGGIESMVKAAVFNVTFLMMYMCYKTHLVSEEALRIAVPERLAALLKGSAEGDIAQRAGVYAAKSRNLVRPEISRVLEEHKTKGHITILLSGMLQPYLEAIKQELGIDIAIGTELEIQDGYYTGRLAGAPHFGERRAQVLREFLDKMDDKVNLDESFAYGDSMFDSFFMGMVGNPVAVYPDNKLAEYAQRHDWNVIR